jgi:hypothetical protein
MYPPEGAIRPVQEEARDLGNVAVRRPCRLDQIEVVLELLATLTQVGCQPGVDLGLSCRRGRRLQLRRAIGGEKQAR